MSDNRRRTIKNSQIHFDDGQFNTQAVTYSQIMNLVPGGDFDSGPNVGNIGDDPTFVDEAADTDSVSVVVLAEGG